MVELPVEATDTCDGQVVMTAVLAGTLDARAKPIPPYMLSAASDLPADLLVAVAS